MTDSRGNLVWAAIRSWGGGHLAAQLSLLAWVVAQWWQTTQGSGTAAPVSPSWMSEWTSGQTGALLGCIGAAVATAAAVVAAKSPTRTWALGSVLAGLAVAAPVGLFLAGVGTDEQSGLSSGLSGLFWALLAVDGLGLAVTLGIVAVRGERPVAQALLTVLVVILVIVVGLWMTVLGATALFVLSAMTPVSGWAAAVSLVARRSWPMGTSIAFCVLGGVTLSFAAFGILMTLGTDHWVLVSMAASPMPFAAALGAGGIAYARMRRPDRVRGDAPFGGPTTG